MSSERLEEMRSGIHRIIEEHIDEIDANNFGPIYDDMWEKEVPMEYVSTLTEQFWEAGIEPLEHMNYVPECYAAFLIEVPDTITIPGNCLELASNAFAYCYVKELILEEGVRGIREHAFHSCEMHTIRLPSSVEYIHNRAFFHCDKLLDIYYEGTVEEFSKIRNSAGGSIMEILPNVLEHDAVLRCKDKNTVIYKNR